MLQPAQPWPRTTPVGTRLRGTPDFPTLLGTVLTRSVAVALCTSVALACGGCLRDVDWTRIPNVPTNVITWPAPAGETPSADFTLAVDGKSVFVYEARVRAEILQQPGLWTHKPDCSGERASFAICDIAGPVTLTVRPARPFRTATILPARAGVVPQVENGCIRFRLEQPQHLSLLLDGSDESPLHIFVGSPEIDVPSPADPNVVYFGPGVHELHQLHVRSGQTVYLAGGAVVKAALAPGEKGTFSEQWKVVFYGGAAFNVQNADHVRICGRGVLDGSLLPHPARQLIHVTDSHDVRIEGIVLRDSANWNLMIQRSANVRVDDLRIVSGRLNSDGINSVNSRDVRISRCFVRNHDDSIVVKTTEPGAPAEDIQAEDCTIWNDWGYALGVTYETRAPVRNVRFHRCNVIYARHWCLGIRVSDSATVSDIAFDDIQIADLATASRQGGARSALTTEPKLVSMSIAKDCWGKDAEAGHIHGISISNVTVDGARLPSSELSGLDTDHAIEDVVFRNIHLRGEPAATNAAQLDLQCNAHVRGIRIEP